VLALEQDDFPVEPSAPAEALAPSLLQQPEAFASLSHAAFSEELHAAFSVLVASDLASDFVIVTFSFFTFSTGCGEDAET